jgi:predicted secreted hydrolase
LRFEQTTTVLLQGDEGLSRKGPDAASYYYSLPRLQTRGQITVGGRQVEVSGWAWLDREWSTSVLGPHLQGWDWFALQLQDGRNLMVFRLRRTDGGRDPYDYGVLVGSDGAVHKLSSVDFELRPLRFWRDEQGIAWPVEWDLQAGGEQMRIRALVDDQVVRQGLVYWEGIVGVTSGGQKLGRGYMELTGYSMP